MIIIKENEFNYMDATHNWIKLNNLEIGSGLRFHRIIIPYTGSGNSIQVNTAKSIKHYHCLSKTGDVNNTPTVNNSETYIKMSYYDADKTNMDNFIINHNTQNGKEDTQFRSSALLTNGLNNGTDSSVSTSDDGKTREITSTGGSKLIFSKLNMNFTGVRTNVQIP